MRKYLYEDLYNLEEKHWWHIAKRRTVKKVIEKYNKIVKPKILDIGCGAGKSMEELQKIGVVYGLDSSKQAINYCLKRGLRNLKLGKAENTNLSSNYFDIITLLDVLEHTDDDLALKEMRRILKRGGLLIITVPAFSWLWSRWDEILHHRRRYSKDELNKILMKNDFKPLKMTHLYSFLILPALVVRKIKEKIFKNFYPSDFQLSNRPVNFLFNKLSELEFSISDNFPLPLGTSILVVAKRND